MNEKKEPNLEELLNSYLDGQLNERQLTELKRLIANDQRIAAKLQRLQRTRELLGALPKSPAPPEILQGVKQRMEGKMLRTEQPAIVTQHRAGVRHLMLRKTLAAAAMIGLVSILALIVYNILKPASPTQPQPAEVTRPERGRLVVSETAVEKSEVIPAAELEDLMTEMFPPLGRGGIVLELSTTEPRAVNSAIARAIYDSGLLECTSIKHLDNEDIYSLNCAQEPTAILASDLRGLWERFEVASLSLAKESFGQRVYVSNVTVEQMATILAETDGANRLKLAGDFATLNTMAALMPGRGILNNIQGREYDLLRVDKPVLTSGRDLMPRPFAGKEQPPMAQAEKISFTIVVKPAE